MVTAQGGSLDAERKVAKATTLLAKQAGTVTQIHAGRFGRAVVQLGGGRQELGDLIDPSVGIELCVEIGQEVEEGQLLARIFADDPPAAAWLDHLREAIEIGPERPTLSPLVMEHITETGN